MTGEPPPKKSGLSLYADLLGQSSSGATISSAPVKYDLKPPAKDAELAAAQKKKDALLKFQPIKRPQVQSKKTGKPASSLSSAHKIPPGFTPTTAGLPNKSLATLANQQPQFRKSNFEDWIGDDDDDFGYQSRQIQQRKNNKKKNKQTRVWSWDDIYDPTFPNVYADYKRSEEQAAEINDWKARLHHRRLKELKRNRDRAAASSEANENQARPANPMLAPPASLNFAPPAFNDAPTARESESDMDLDDYYRPVSQQSTRRFDAPVFVQSTAQDDVSGEEAYLRRMRIGQIGASEAQTVPRRVNDPASNRGSVSSVSGSSNAPQKPAPAISADIEAKRAEAQAKIAAFKAKLGKPPTPSQTAAPGVHNINSAGPQRNIHLANSPQSLPPLPPPPLDVMPGIISRAPVRYELPAASMPLSDANDPDALEADGEVNAATEQDRPRASRPGQKGFAERLLMKYGWEKGQGLGAKGDGITTAIIAKADKRKKRSDAEGGGFAAPANMGTIVGGNRRRTTGDDPENDDGGDNKTSEVVKIVGMLDGVNVADEIENHNMMQQIGDQMASKYGNVERLFIWRSHAGGNDEVFVKFTSGLSALRAVNAVDGIEFAGNNVRAKFFDSEKFDKGEYVWT